MTAALAELTRANEQATAERQAAEAHERATAVAVEQGKMALADATLCRLGLVETLESASAAELAGMDRLGNVRLGAASAERELERLGDAAALGSDAASRSLSKARDAAETGSDLTSAHERRVAILRSSRETSERDLAAHDRSVTDAVGEQLEAALLTAAERADELLQQVAAIVGLVGGLVDVRRQVAAASGVPVHESWQTAIGRQHGRWCAALQASYRAYQVLEENFRATGPTHPGSPLATAAREIVDAWGQHRRPANPKAA